MAIPFRIVLYSPEGMLATNAARAAFARIHELNSLLSDYDPNSELSRLSRTAGSGEAATLSRELATVLGRAQKVSAASRGAFDVTVGPLVQLWRRARRQGELPDPARLAEAKAAVGWESIQLKNDSRAAPGSRTSQITARLLKPGMRLDLGAIAKGYALDEATRVLKTNGIRCTLVTGAGDMVAGHSPPGQPGWKIELPPLDLPGAPPGRTVWLRNRSLATSGDLFQHVEINDVRYSHIVDPHTGYGLTDHGLVTAVGRDGITTDAVATALSVLPTNRGLALARKFGVQARIIRAPGGKLEVAQSPGFPR